MSDHWLNEMVMVENWPPPPPPSKWKYENYVKETLNVKTEKEQRYSNLVSTCSLAVGCPLCFALKRRCSSCKLAVIHLHFSWRYHLAGRNIEWFMYYFIYILQEDALFHCLTYLDKLSTAWQILAKFDMLIVCNQPWHLRWTVWSMFPASRFGQTRLLLY